MDIADDNIVQQSMDATRKSRAKRGKPVGKAVLLEIIDRAGLGPLKRLVRLSWIVHDEIMIANCQSSSHLKPQKNIVCLYDLVLLAPQETQTNL